MNFNHNSFEKKNGVYQLRDEIAVPTGKVLMVLRDAKSGRIVDIDMVKNLFVTAGKNSLAAGLAGIANSGFITYCALGTGTNVPAYANTTLQTEIIRKLISVRSVAGNIATFQTFFNTSEGNATLKEVGLFGGLASGTVDSGTLFCRTAINRIKNSAQTLTLYWSVTIG